MGSVNRSMRAGRRRSALVAGLVLMVLSIALAACSTATAVPEIPVATTGSTITSGSVLSSVPPTSSPTEVTVPGVPVASAETALAVLSTLPVQGRAPQTGYSRAQFGQTWTDDVTVDGGHNGCDTRNDILRRDITDAQIKPGTQGCVVLSGTLADPYTGTVVPFLRGAETSDDVQIDHWSPFPTPGSPARSNSPRSNGRTSPTTRSICRPPSGRLNQQKGAGDAATWLPPNKSYRCTYVARQIEVKAKYQLWVKPAERDAMAGFSVIAARSRRPRRQFRRLQRRQRRQPNDLRLIRCSPHPSSRSHRRHR